MRRAFLLRVVRPQLLVVRGVVSPRHSARLKLPASYLQLVKLCYRDLMFREHRLVAIIPSSNLDASEAFYAKLGFTRVSDYGNYRLLADGKGGELHLNAFPGWPIPAHNPLGLYLYAENVDELARAIGNRVLHQPERKPW